VPVAIFSVRIGPIYRQKEVYFPPERPQSREDGGHSPIGVNLRAPLRQCSGGTRDSRPAIYRRLLGKLKDFSVPEGRLSQWPRELRDQSSLPGLWVDFVRFPGDESPGYFRLVPLGRKKLGAKVSAYGAQAALQEASRSNVGRAVPADYGCRLQPRLDHVIGHFFWQSL